MPVAPGWLYARGTPAAEHSNTKLCTQVVPHDNTVLQCTWMMLQYSSPSVCRPRPVVSPWYASRVASRVSSLCALMWAQEPPRPRRASARASQNSCPQGEKNQKKPKKPKKSHTHRGDRWEKGMEKGMHAGMK